MKFMKKSIILVALLSLVTLGNNISAQSVSGAGATFPQPFYNAAFVTYEKLTNVKVTYGGIGSGGGIRSLKDKIVDFGAFVDIGIKNDGLHKRVVARSKI